MYLFVYGTLMRAFNNPFAIKLHQESEFIGRTSIPGKLFDAGDYPYAIYQQDALSRVNGEIFRLTSPDILKALDEYEEFGPDFPEPNEYIRISIPAEWDRQVYDCWFYQYNHPINQAAEINSGDYYTYLLNKQNCNNRCKL